MIVNFLSYDIILYVITALASVGVLSYCQKVLDGNEDFGIRKKLICGAINGIILLELLTSGGMMSSLLLLFGCPLLLVAELFLYTRDKGMTYFFIFSKLSMNFISIFWIVAAMAGLGSGLHDYHREITVFTLIFTGSLAFFLGKTPYYPMNELKIIVHQWDIGKIFFVYLALGDLFLMVSSILMAPFLEGRLLEGEVMSLISADMIIKTSAILGFSYVLLYMQANRIRTGKAYQEVMINLENEKKFRNTVQKKGMMNLQVNVTKGILKEGEEYFPDRRWIGQKKYEGAIHMLAKKVVHPLDQEAFVEHNTIYSILEKLETNPYFSEQIRISPKEIIRYISFPEPVKKKYENSQKPWMWIKIDYIYTREPKTGEISMFLVIFDVDEEVDLNEKLRISASTDALTGLLNRTFMQYEIEKKLREENGKGTMILLDVDNFKQVNDKLGHPKGDEVLIRFSGVLREMFRRNDVIGRLGGDEFAVFLPGILPEEVLEEKMKQLSSRCIFTYFSDRGDEIKTSVSIGIVLADENDSYETLYKKADKSLYKSKEKGKNTHTYYQKI